MYSDNVNFILLDESEEKLPIFFDDYKYDAFVSEIHNNNSKYSNVLIFCTVLR